MLHHPLAGKSRFAPGDRFGDSAMLAEQKIDEAILLVKFIQGQTYGGLKQGVY